MKRYQYFYVRKTFFVGELEDLVPIEGALIEVCDWGGWSDLLNRSFVILTERCRHRYPDLRRTISFSTEGVFRKKGMFDFDNLKGNII